MDWLTLCYKKDIASLPVLEFGWGQKVMDWNYSCKIWVSFQVRALSVHFLITQKASVEENKEYVFSMVYRNQWQW